MANPAWRTRKASIANSLRQQVDLKSKEVKSMEIELASLKESLEEAESSDLPILLYACDYKDSDSGRHDYDHFYYLPDLKISKIDHNTRFLYVPNENHQRPGTLDLRTVFKNCHFPEEISSENPDFWKLRQKNQPYIDKAIINLESVIDQLFACEEIKSWQHLGERIIAHYFPDKKRKPNQHAKPELA